MNVAFIPVRGGSKSIPLKNIKKINGKPLVYWTIAAAAKSENIDKIYVATDSAVIKETVESFGFSKVVVINRSAETAYDTASTESAMLEFANNYDFDNITLIQATSPLLTTEDIDGGFALFNEKNTDSVLSVVRQKRFIWKEADEDEGGESIPQNYNPLSRPRRQEFDGYLVENGAYYITTRKRLLETQCRISGRIKTYEMAEETYFEIDEPSDWIIVEHLLESKTASLNGASTFPDIKMFLTDCDGCLTDGGMYYSVSGDELKMFNTKDGMGFSLLKKAGIITGIITSENIELVKRRAEKLKIDELHMGATNKLDVIRSLSTKYNICPENIAYIGDDINDLDVIKTVGFGCSVNNAIDTVKSSAKYVTKRNGGDGAVREVIDLILARCHN